MKYSIILVAFLLAACSGATEPGPMLSQTWVITNRHQGTPDTLRILNGTCTFVKGNESATVAMKPTKFAIDIAIDTAVILHFTAVSQDSMAGHVSYWENYGDKGTWSIPMVYVRH